MFLTSLKRPTTLNTLKISARCFTQSTGPFTSVRQKFRLWSRNGSLEFFLGGSLLTIITLDRILQYQQHQSRQHIKDQLQAEANIPSTYDLQELQDWLHRPVLFQCRIRKLAQNLDGTKCLKDVSIGEVVHVIEEKVGPGDMYNLCKTLDRNGKPISVGWFPTMYLEKI